jgi:hypothetical protein
VKIGQCKVYIRPYVEAGKNTSTVIPASRKRRRKGNPAVSDETVMNSYESSAPLNTDSLYYKLQTLPLVREGTPKMKSKTIVQQKRGKVKSSHGPQRGA